YDLFFPRAEAWLWPVAIIAAAGLLGFFIYKGLSNVNVDVSGKTQHNVEVTGGTENNINHNFNIFSSGTR
ncbi:MAG: hypothetical protein KDD43_08750, partial [Bdellovibrionales bacterium]|nr:hypothetical protein [Bdellovibrionales bacterium]